MAALIRLGGIGRWWRGSLWAVPSAMTLGATLLAFVMVSLDMRLPFRTRADWWFVFGVGPDGVRGVLSAIAGSIITVAGVVFSITVVALQLASTQYSPRVLRTFLEDRWTHAVLGTFIATFVYALLVLRTVRAESPSAGEFVPSLSVSVAMMLGLVSVGMLIFFVHHIAQSIRASVIVKRLTLDGRAIVERAFPSEVGTTRVPAGADPDTTGWCEWRVVADRAGYLSIVDERLLFTLERRIPDPTVVRMATRIGEFVRTGDPLATVEAPSARDRDVIDAAVRESFTLEVEPTGPQDVALALTRLTDVAVRALSPGQNDPATAATCLDGLSEVLVAAGQRQPPHPVRLGPRGTMRFVACYPTFEELAALALDPIRHHGAGDPAIGLKLLDTLRAVGQLVHPTRRPVMLAHVPLVLRASESRLTDGDALERIRDRATNVRTALAHV